MPEIIFKIDTENGKCETEIKGYQGPACEKTAQRLRQVLGEPSHEIRKKEFFLTPQARQTLKRK